MDGQSLLKCAQRVVVAEEPLFDVTDVAEGVCLSGPVVELAIDG